MSDPNRPQLTRRDLLALGLGTAASLAVGRGAAAAPDSDYGPFRMGLQSYSLRHFGIDDALAHTKAYGLHFWESYNAHIPTTADENRLNELKKRAKAAGVQVVGFGVIKFTKDHDANRKLFDFGKTLGLEYFSCAPDRDAFDSLDKLVEEYGIPVGIHNHGPEDRLWSKIDTIAGEIKDHSPKIGCCIDTGHFLRSKEDPVRAVEVFDDRIYGVHLKDVKDAKTFTVLGEGDLDLVGLMKALARRNYKYCMALEYEENPTAPDDEIIACLKAARAAAAKV